MHSTHRSTFGKNFILIILVLSSLFTAAMGYYLLPYPDKDTHTQTQSLNFPKGSSFDKEWKKVDSLTNLGLTQSALTVVEGIYAKAKSEKNASQIVKAIIHRIKLESYTEEYSLQKSIDKLNEEIKNSKYPLRPVLHSMLAELYWNYYEVNRWKFQNRTQAVNFKLNDINTWDLKTIVDHTVKQYQLSLQDADSLKRTPLNIYDNVIMNDEESAKRKAAQISKLRTSLYDFLAHRAVDFYINEEPDIIKPAYKFELNSASYFSKYDDFSKLKIENKDSLSLKFYAIKILQDLISFHGNNIKDTEELVDVDLKRLKFVRNKSTVDGKDSLYLQALQDLEKKFMQNPVSTDVSYEIAQTYIEKANRYKPLVSDESKWEKKTALSVCEDAIKRFPESFGAGNCKYLQAIIKNKSLAFNVEEENLPDKPFRTRVEYTNVNKIYLRIIKQDEDRFNKEVENYYGENLVKKFLKASVVKEWTIDLPDDGDYQSHSVEIKVDGLPLGHYVILAGSDKSFSYEKNGVAYADCFITEMTYVQRRAANGSYGIIQQNRLF